MRWSSTQKSTQLELTARDFLDCKLMDFLWRISVKERKTFPGVQVEQLHSDKNFLYPSLQLYIFSLLCAKPLGKRSFTFPDDKQPLVYKRKTSSHRVQILQVWPGTSVHWRPDGCVSLHVVWCTLQRRHFAVRSVSYSSCVLRCVSGGLMRFICLARHSQRSLQEFGSTGCLGTASWLASMLCNAFKWYLRLTYSGDKILPVCSGCKWLFFYPLRRLVEILNAFLKVQHLSPFPRPMCTAVLRLTCPALKKTKKTLKNGSKVMEDDLTEVPR